MILTNNQELVYGVKIDEQIFHNILKEKPNLFMVKDNLLFSLDIEFLIHKLNTSGFNMNPRINKILFGFMAHINIFISLKIDIRNGISSSMIKK